ncbi:MAG: GNAT family N-acetyltransferase [Lewinella sp.]|nr:GNAT family N-acetyltransferase [Lewinella sp.]
MIRPYQPADKDQLLALIRLNIPQYFAPEEAADFEEYLDRYAETYFVYEENGRITGSGGINYFPESGLARISWDFVHPDHHGKGIGRQLTRHRIETIGKHPDIHKIQVRTSQLAYRFYEKMGFTLESTEKDFWAEGFDLYSMGMLLPR